MRNAMRHLIATGLLLFASQSTSAQQEVVLSFVMNGSGDSLLSVGYTHEMIFRVRNFSPSNCNSQTLEPNIGFVIYSPDGATWQDTWGVFEPSFRDAGLWIRLEVDKYDDPILGDTVSRGDGISPDYIAFRGTALSGHGMPNGLDANSFRIGVITDRADTNLHICIDSSSIGKLESWNWASADINCDVAPRWGGPYCFRIADVTPEPASHVHLDNVTNSLDDSTLVGGRTHTISLRAEVLTWRRCQGIGLNPNNGFVLYSPDGAKWDHTSGSLSDDFLAAGNWIFKGPSHYEDPIDGDTVTMGDGISPDYVGFWGVSFTNEGGLQSGFDDPAYLIEIKPQIADSNLHICLDSSSLGKLFSWGWASILAVPCRIKPGWGGPYCFVIRGAGCSGDLNSDGDVNEADLETLIQYYFGFGPPPAVGTGDVNVDGTIDIGDIVYLANFLHNGGPAPCAGTGPGGFDWKDKPDTRKAGND